MFESSISWELVVNGVGFIISKDFIFIISLIIKHEAENGINAKPLLLLSVHKAIEISNPRIDIRCWSIGFGFNCCQTMLSNP